MDETRTVGTGQKDTKKRLSAYGFTLVEVLVVIGIISVIAAITIPVISHARESGRRTVCQSNLRQIAAAMQQYVQDYDGVYPHVKFAYKIDGVSTVVSWQEALFPYTKSREIFRCPSQSKALPGSDDGYALNDERLNLFKWSEGNPRILTIRGTHEANLPQSSTVWLNGDRIAVEDYHCVDCIGTEPSCGGRFYGSTVHGQGGNYSFLDGHIKWFTPAAVAEVDCKNDPLPKN